MTRPYLLLLVGGSPAREDDGSIFDVLSMQWHTGGEKWGAGLRKYVWRGDEKALHCPLVNQSFLPLGEKPVSPANAMN